MVECHFEFIITLNRQFYFSTSVRTCPTCQPNKAKQLYKDFCERFPESEGFEVLVEEVTCYGSQRTLDFATGRF